PTPRGFLPEIRSRLTRSKRAPEDEKDRYDAQRDRGIKKARTGHCLGMGMTLTQRAALASMSAILTVIATYAVLRGFDVLFKSEPNPATIIWAPRIAMFWRLVVGSYAASLVAAGVFFASTGRLEA